jgi:uncharacterized protein with FMN-binding domain
MRRIVTLLLSTITVLVLLFSYHTSTDSGSPSVVAAPSGGAATGATPDTPTPSATTPAPAGADPGTGSGDDGAGDDGGTATTPSPSATPSPSSTPSPSAKTPSSSTKTYTGDQVTTRWGPVQVEITVAGGKITAAQAVQYPSGNGRDAEINSYALPVLNQEVVDRQSAQIDTVSGATVTSDGYLQSLQSALDQAHL